jgi:zinc transporter ZupT
MALWSGAALIFRPTDYLSGIVAVLFSLMLAIFLTQTLGITWRAPVALGLCAMFQLPIGVILAWIFLATSSKWLSDPNWPLILIMAYLAGCLLVGASLNLCYAWHLQQSTAKPQLIRQLSLAEIFAVLTGICSTAAVVGLLLRR